MVVKQKSKHGPNKTIWKYFNNDLHLIMGHRGATKAILIQGENVDREDESGLKTEV